MSQNSDAPKTVMQRILDVVERVGNKVPHPAAILLMLIETAVILSHVMHRAGVAEIHTVKEYVDLPEFAQGCRLAVALATLE